MLMNYASEDGLESTVLSVSYSNSTVYFPFHLRESSNPGGRENPRIVQSVDICVPALVLYIQEK